MVKRFFASGTTTAAAGVTGAHTLALTGFNDANYQAGVEPAGDPGPAFRWWVITKTPASLTIGFLATNEVPLTITAAG